RLAMNVSSAGGMTWSPVPITAQDGMVFQAGGPDGSVNALAVSGRWVAAMTAAWLAGSAQARSRAWPSGRLLPPPGAAPLSRSPARIASVGIPSRSPGDTGAAIGAAPYGHARPLRHVA